MEPKEILAAILKRRSCRRYQQKAVLPHKLAALDAIAETLSVPFEHEVEILPFSANGTKSLFTTLDMNTRQSCCKAYTAA